MHYFQTNSATILEPLWIHLPGFPGIPIWRVRGILNRPPFKGGGGGVIISTCTFFWSSWDVVDHQVLPGGAWVVLGSKKFTTIPPYHPAVGASAWGARG